MCLKDIVQPAPILVQYSPSIYAQVKTNHGHAPPGSFPRPPGVLGLPCPAYIYLWSTKNTLFTVVSPRTKKDIYTSPIPFAFPMPKSSSSSYPLPPTPHPLFLKRNKNPAHTRTLFPKKKPLFWSLQT